MTDLLRREDAIEVIEQLLSTPYGRPIVYKGDIVSRKVALDALWKIGEEDNQTSAQPEIVRCGQCKYAEVADAQDNQDGYTCQFHRGNIWFSGSYCSWAERRDNE